MIESKIQRTQTFKPEDPKIVNISKMVYQEAPPVSSRQCRQGRRDFNLTKFLQYQNNSRYNFTDLKGQTNI